MNKKRLKFSLIGFLLMINVFNILFIIYKLKGSGYIREAGRTIYDYFTSSHLILLFIFICIISVFLIIKKLSISSYLYLLFLAIITYSMAINFSLIPKINRQFGLSKYDFHRKKTGSLNEAISKSPANFAKVMNSYIEMNHHLNRKTLVIPYSSPIEKDYFFKVFITPKTLVEKDYSHRIPPEGFELLKNYPSNVFYAFWQIKEINKYIIIKAHPESDELILLEYDKNFIFLPSDLIRRHSLNLSD